MIAIIDYGMGNLRSVQKAFEFIGLKAYITDDANSIKMSKGVVLPGVGHFKDAMRNLRNRGLDEIIYDVIEAGKPFLGICLGMQLLFDYSYEGGKNKGLSILSGEIVRFPSNIKVPHMGWNNLIVKKKTVLFDDLPQNPYVYFVHSYYLETDDLDIVIAETEYDGYIKVAVQKDNIFATQFHPEKSGDIGLKILNNYGRLIK